MSDEDVSPCCDVDRHAGVGTLGVKCVYCGHALGSHSPRHPHAYRYRDVTCDAFVIPVNINKPLRWDISAKVVRK